MLLNLARIERLAAEDTDPITAEQAVALAGVLAKGAPHVLPPAGVPVLT